MKINKKIIKELSDYLDEFNLTELEYTEKDTKIKVSKNNFSISNQSNQISDANNKTKKSISDPSNIKSGIEVTSPIIGTAYHAPEPGAKKFVEIGKKIKKGDTVMIVEAMKTMKDASLALLSDQQAKLSSPYFDFLIQGMQTST